MILRAKGIVDGGADGWLEFDMVPASGNPPLHPDVAGKLCVIGSQLKARGRSQTVRPD